MMKDKSSDKETPLSRQSIYYRQTIDSLKTETKKLKEQMSLETTAPLPVTSESYIARLQDQEDTFTKKIRQEKQKNKELDRKIAEVKQKIAEKRISLAIPKDKNMKESNETILLKIKKTEHKYDKTLQKYTEVLARNKNLREEINNVRREKKVSEEILKNLDDEFKTSEEEENRISSVAEKLQDTCWGLKKRLDELKFQKKIAEHERDKFLKDWKELNKIIDKEINSEEVFQRLDKIDTPETEKQEYKSINEENGSLGENYSILEAAKKLNLFSEAFKKLEEATGISDVDGLVNIFVEAEKHNYSLFSHVNELTNDILKLDEQILEMKNEIQKYKNFGIKTVAQKEKILNDLEEKLNFTELRSDIYEKRYEKTMKIIMIFKIGIHQLLEKIGASEMLTEEGVNEGNLMHYLGLIELRTNEILQMFKYCQNSAVESPMVNSFTFHYCENYRLFIEIYSSKGWNI